MNNIKSYTFLIPVIFVSFSCKMRPGSGGSSGSGGNPVFKLRLAPPIGSKYYYALSSRTELKLDAEAKKVDNLSKSDIGVIYTIDKDSTGSLEFHINYDKIHLYSKTADGESNMDAASDPFHPSGVDRL